MREPAARLGLWLLDYLAAARGQLRALRGPVPSATGSGGRPVVLVPGVYETARFLSPLARVLADAGHPVHAVPALGWNREQLPAGAERVAAVLGDADLRDAVLIAHSKGGLIGKYAMLRQDPDRRIAAMIAVATPFSGSIYARYLPGTLHSFSPADATLGMLGGELEVNSRITSIWGRFDPHIPGGCRLPGAVNVELPIGGHFRILEHPLLHRAVLRALGDPGPDEP